jgi:phage tail protein X
MTTYITKLYDRLDKICYKFYGDSDNRIVETVLDQNPGLEEHGILLPLGLKIELPRRPVKNLTPIIRQVFLWD